RVEIARQIVNPAMQVLLERGKPRFRPLDPGLGGSGSGHADFGQALRVLTQLADRLLVKPANGCPLAFDQVLEPLKARGGVALKARLDFVQAGKARFELANDVREPLLSRLRVVVRFAPAQKGVGQAIDLRLEIDKALLVRSGRKHCALWRA